MERISDTVRIVRKGIMKTNADAVTVFPLLCPVKECDWIEGWEDVCTLVHSESGIAEEACVFETDLPGEGHAVWICSKYDAANTRIEYIKHIVGKAIIKWNLDVVDLPGGGSKINCLYNITGMGSEGTQYAKHLGEGLEDMFAALEARINYYVATGEKMKE